jgi:hypothetical protein
MGNDTVPAGAGRSDTESASREDTKSGRPQTSLDEHDTVPVGAGRSDAESASHEDTKSGRLQRMGNDTVPEGAGRSDTESASDEDTKSGRPHRWTTYNTTRTARSVLGSPACVETPSPDRAQRPGADLYEHRSEELPLLRKQGPGPHVASWGADLDENHSEELLSRYQAKTVQWTVFGF